MLSLLNRAGTLLSRKSRRRAVLLIFGVIYTLSGVGYLSYPLVPIQEQIFHLALNIMSIGWWAVLWLVIGVGSIILSLITRIKDTYAYGALTLYALWWTCVYTSGFLFYGIYRAWSGSLLFFALSALLLVISGWKDD